MAPQAAPLRGKSFQWNPINCSLRKDNWWMEWKVFSFFFSSSLYGFALSLLIAPQAVMSRRLLSRGNNNSTILLELLHWLPWAADWTWREEEIKLICLHCWINKEKWRWLNGGALGAKTHNQQSATQRSWSGGAAQIKPFNPFTSLFKKSSFLSFWFDEVKLKCIITVIKGIKWRMNLKK